MFTISSSPLKHKDLRKNLTSSRAGAFSSFEGWVRDINDGKQVIALEYEAYEPLCHSQAQKIFTEVKDKFNVMEARAVHRIGRLDIGDMAVWVGVIAEHRDDSFKACRYIIDQIKYRLPIWKKETYVNGKSDWVICSACAIHPQPAHTQ